MQPTVRSIRVENVVVGGCRSTGIDLAGATGIAVESSTVESCGGIGIFAYEAIAVDTVARRNVGRGFFGIDRQYTRCVASENGGVGFDVTRGVYHQCQALNNGGRGFFGGAGNATGCVAHFAQSHGFDLGEGQVQNCSFRDNGGDGFRLPSGSVVGCVAMDNRGSGIVASNGRVSDSVAHYNYQHGISIGSSVRSSGRATGNNRPNGDCVHGSDTGGCTRTGNNPAPSAACRSACEA